MSKTGLEMESEGEKTTGLESDYESAEEEDTVIDYTVKEPIDLRNTSIDSSTVTKIDPFRESHETVDISTTESLVKKVDIKDSSELAAIVVTDSPEIASKQQNPEMVHTPDDSDIAEQASDVLPNTSKCSNASLETSSIHEETVSVDTMLQILAEAKQPSENFHVSMEDSGDVNSAVIKEESNSIISDENLNVEIHTIIKSEALTSMSEEDNHSTRDSSKIAEGTVTSQSDQNKGADDSNSMILSDDSIKEYSEKDHAESDSKVTATSARTSPSELEDSQESKHDDKQFYDNLNELVIGTEDSSQLLHDKTVSGDEPKENDDGSFQDLLLVTETVLVEETCLQTTIEALHLVSEHLDVATELDATEYIDACDEVVDTVLPSENSDLAEITLEDAALPDGTEELSSLEGFCGGSTSGDLLDEEGGMEGAAEVDEDCMFLEDDEEPLGEDEEDGQEYVEGERQQGDGEESTSPCPSKEKKLDDDEDRRNPQYIPKKGSFYEHDDRAGSEAEEDKEQKDKDKKKTKKLWSDDGRWGHDMFRVEEQGPKLREELVASYGYDIRSEDGPPRARRRRRYGRGPNKYTRNWQDEDAYFKNGHEGEKPELSPRSDNLSSPEDRGTKPPNRGRAGYRGTRSFRGGRSNQDLHLDSQNNEVTETKDSNTKDISPPDSSTYATAVNNNKTSEVLIAAEEFPALPSKEPIIESVAVSQEIANQPLRPVSPVEAQVFRTLTFENSRFTGRSDNREGNRGRGRSRGSSLANQERPNVRGKRGGGSRGNYHRAPPLHPTDADLYDLQAEMEKMKLQESGQSLQTTQRKEAHRERLTAQNPEMASSQRTNEGRPKRYSSLRQRGVQEVSTYQPPITPTQQYYEPGYRGPVYSELPSNAQHPVTSAPPVNPMMNPTFPGNFNPAAYQETYAMRAPLPSPPRLYHPQTQLPQGPPVVTSPYMGDSMVPGGPIMNYAAPPPPHATAAYPPQFQLMQAYPGPPQPAPPPPAVVPQTHEMYTGITYYSPHGQQFVTGGRALPLKRPKAAIPIVPPPDSQDMYELYDARGADPATGALEVES